MKERSISTQLKYKPIALEQNFSIAIQGEPQKGNEATFKAILNEEKMDFSICEGVKRMRKRKRGQCNSFM